LLIAALLLNGDLHPELYPKFRVESGTESRYSSFSGFN
jgi:hypothetical protein